MFIDIQKPCEPRTIRQRLRDDDVILSGTFDRLVVLYDGDRAVGADVLDYKTDDLPADDARAVDARVEHYRPQLAAYRRAAAKLLGLEPASVSTRLLFVGPGIIRSIQEANTKRLQSEPEEPNFHDLISHP